MTAIILTTPRLTADLRVELNFVKNAAQQLLVNSTLHHHFLPPSYARRGELIDKESVESKKVTELAET